MENKDLRDQLEGLFSDLNDVPSSKAAVSPAPRRARAKTRQGEEVIFNTDYTASKINGREGQVKPHSLPAIVSPPVYAAPRRPVIHWRMLSLAVIGTLGVIVLVIYGQSILTTLRGQPQPETPAVVAPLSPTPTVTRAATATPEDITPEPALMILEPSATPTPITGGASLTLKAEAANVGWLVNQEESKPFEASPANHFGDSFLYAGILEGKVYQGAFQFDLRRIPRGTHINAASVKLVGLRADQLDRAQNSEWQLQMLSSAIDDRWSEHTYQQISQAEAIYSFKPALVTEALYEETEYNFELEAEALALLEQRILEGGDNFGRVVSFRLVGPTTGPDNLFAWDTGYGPASQGDAPALFLSVGPPPAETPLPYYVVVTSTPTPENVVTAAAFSVEMTAQAKRNGTATPLPPNWITPFAVTATPAPGNKATAAAMSEVATAIALTTGEPPAIVTATSTPPYVIITSTPTAQNIATAVVQALQNSLATPLPPNWVTPVVVTITPTPENDATVEYYKAVALTTGTPTPMPANVQTATATPVSVAVDPLAEPTATVTPSPTPQAIPASLMGKVIFLSDREGATEEERARADRLGVKPEVIPVPYVFDPATGELSRLTDIWPYQVVTAREGWSADEKFQTYVKQLLWTNVQTPKGNVATEVYAVHYYDFTYNVEKVVTNFGTGIAYDPVWSPVNNEIALVATESGNDEIWRINYDGSELQQLTKNSWEWDKHPTWSPDGQQIVFYSNRTGNNQIWMMNRDGSNQRLLMEANPYNDFDPVWVKNLEPAPALDRLPDWRFVKPDGQ